MDSRKEQILNTIIREYIKTAIPVSSAVIVDKYKLDVSPATVRNDMAILEEEGFIIQPHTSAGRIPTEKAYLRYVAELKPKKLKDIEEVALADILKTKDEESIKKASRFLCHLSGLAVFLGLSQEKPLLYGNFQFIDSAGIHH